MARRTWAHNSTKWLEIWFINWWGQKSKSSNLRSSLQWLSASTLTTNQRSLTRIKTRTRSQQLRFSTVTTLTKMWSYQLTSKILVLILDKTPYYRLSIEIWICKIHRFNSLNLLRADGTSWNGLRVKNHSDLHPTRNHSKSRRAKTQTQFTRRKRPAVLVIVSHHSRVVIHLIRFHKITRFQSKMLIYLESQICIENLYHQRLFQIAHPIMSSHCHDHSTQREGPASLLVMSQTTYFLDVHQ